MLDNEIRSASWKFGLIFLISLIVLTQIPTSYDEIVRITEIDRQFMQEETEQLREEEGLSEAEIYEMYGPTPSAENQAMNELSNSYTGLGTVAMVLLAGLLGIGLVSSEVGGGTILAILSRPVSRRRVFLTKYLTGATFLLVASVLGTVGLFGAAWLRDYPLEAVTWGGVALAVVLMWFAALFVFGVAMLVSTLTRNVMQSLIATVAAVFLILALPNLVPDLLIPLFLGSDSYLVMENIYSVTNGLTLFNYWPDTSYIWGGDPYNFGFYGSPTFFSNSVTGDFAVTIFAAIVPAVAGLWVFGRKKF